MLAAAAAAGVGSGGAAGGAAAGSGLLLVLLGAVRVVGSTRGTTAELKKPPHVNNIKTVILLFVLFVLFIGCVERGVEKSAVGIYILLTFLRHSCC